ncbi:TetR/AcrR family transcriptional regulator [Actinoallomurus sp. NPDC050550]|uniref:TetR/AcrR family transcriptional regulator n=1 Tax=Actinoallomurus sp. NPDC050550 TaxID=3154937 RepID=UPI0033F22324
MAGERRRRRTPAEAREEILTAAAALIAERGPDGVGLRQVAEAVGVTHGLVTHYFGTYGALVREVLRRENALLRERVRDRIRAEAGLPTAKGMMGVLFDTLADERYVRLWAWAELHADLGMADLGLRELVDAMDQGIRAVLPWEEVPGRDRIEAVVLLGLSSAYGYALGHRSWLSGLGHDPADPDRDAAFRSDLTTVLAGYMTEASGLVPRDKEER